MAAIVQDAFMLFGDSLTQRGWQSEGLVQRLADAYARKLDVINRGFSGYNSNCAIPVFEQCFATNDQAHHTQSVRLLTIWLGANDSCLEFSPQHVPLDVFTTNIRQLVQMVRSPTSPRYSPHTKIILITPPPVNTYQREAELAARNPPEKLDRAFEVTRQYAEAVKFVGFQETIPVVDAWTMMYEGAEKDERKLEKFLWDGLHLTMDGYKLIYESLMKTIGAHYPELHCDNMQFVFPSYACRKVPEGDIPHNEITQMAGNRLERPLLAAGEENRRGIITQLDAYITARHTANL